jgi:hypothetical protein
MNGNPLGNMRHFCGMARVPISQEVEKQVLLLCRRRCCICFGLNRDVKQKQGQIAHLSRDSGDSDLDNLAFLCLPHHDDYDSRTSQSKGLRESEVRQYRKELYKKIVLGLTGETNANRLQTKHRFRIQVVAGALCILTFLILALLIYGRYHRDKTTKAVTPGAPLMKPDPPFDEEKKIVNNLMDEYLRTHAESAPDEWINQQIKIQGYAFHVVTQYEGSANPDPSKPPVLIDNHGKIDHVTLLGGGMNNSAGAQASYIRADLRPWFAFVLKVKSGELKEQTRQIVESAIKKKKAEIEQLPLDQREAQLQSLEAVAQQLRAVEYNPEKVRILLQQWSLSP